MNETVIFDAARRIVDLGSKDLGYKYVVMDDCWSAGRNSSGYLVHDKKKFPNGIAHVAEKIHELGLKVGIYPSAGSMTCARYEGSLGYEQKDADVWASWGVDYLKYDNCYNEGQGGTSKLSFDRYNAMSKALNSTGQLIVYSMYNWGVDGPWNFAPTTSNSWRTSGDLINEGLDCKLPGYHCSIMNVLDMAAFMPSKAYAGAWTGLDLLRMFTNSLWTAVKSPLMMSNIMTQIDPQTLSILPNPAKGEIQLYSGSLSSGDQVILLLNAGTKTREMTVSLAEIFWDEGVKDTAAQAAKRNCSVVGVTAHDGAEKVYSDVSSSSYKHLMGSKIGSVGPRGAVKATVRPHGVAMYKLREQKRDEL
ncbi:glycoside hydrolase family 27 protein [Aspergillus glaucus CBS 516.65]|uniref:Alpha-galactosidase n=1 Tax=Aspergillus glaucus CBS 516.65 TaxID=1160497 RepID=A0A1L9VMQ2_ASPGL|nr:hypothetical protein ASPGLDRAFT_65976 [Aspergillus glaucus CBS 516.65]OJJ85203.1 hypothetical protein ASPGLDRAFT_65976 [Aspergillus glaucus CBS 516.65]